MRSVLRVWRPRTRAVRSHGMSDRGVRGGTGARRRQHQSIYGAVNGRLRARPPEWALEREGGFGTYRAHLPNARIPGHRLQSFLQWRKGAGGLHHDGPR